MSVVKTAPEWFSLNNYDMNNLTAQQWYQHLRFRSGYFEAVLISENAVSSDGKNNWNKMEVDTSIVGPNPEHFWNEYLEGLGAIEELDGKAPILVRTNWENVLGRIGVEIDLRATDEQITQALKSILKVYRKEFDWPNQEKKPGPPKKIEPVDYKQFIHTLKVSRVLAVFDLLLYSKIFDQKYGYEMLGKWVFQDMLSSVSGGDAKEKVRDVVVRVIPNALVRYPILCFSRVEIITP